MSATPASSAADASSGASGRVGPALEVGVVVAERTVHLTRESLVQIGRASWRERV